MPTTDTQPTLDQRVRLFIFEHFAEHASPPVVEQLMTWFDMDRVPLYADKLSMNYRRPAIDKLRAHFASLGLTSPYWQI